MAASRPSTTKPDPFDISPLTGGPLIRAARAFQDNIRIRDAKLKTANDKNSNLEKELTELQSKMDSKMAELQDLQDLAEKTKPAAHILETVMGELEQRNLEISSLLKSSERSRNDMESMLKEQNEELTTLRANTLIMRTLEEEVVSLTEKKNVLNDQIRELEQDVTENRRSEQGFTQRIHDIERERELAEQEYSSKCLDMNSKLQFAEEQVKEKDDLIERTELTIKELFEKCSQLGTSNNDIKNELVHCLDSGKRLKDLNTKLQFCKDYLEQQVDELIKDLKASKGSNEQLKLEMSNLSREKQNYAKQVLLLEEQQKQSFSEIHLLKEKVADMEKHLQEYESGNVRSATVIAETNRERDSHETVRLALEKQVRNLEGESVLKDDELKNAHLYGRKLKTDLMQLHSKIEFYQQHFIEKQELQKVKSDLEIKYKLDLNTQLQKVSAMFEQEQNDLIATMRTSLNHRQQESEFDHHPQSMGRSYRTYN